MINHEHNHNVSEFNVIYPSDYGIDYEKTIPVAEMESKVYRGMHPLTKESVAIKIYDKPVVYPTPSGGQYVSLTSEDLKFYKDMTQYVKDRIDGIQISFPLISNISYFIEILPIDTIALVGNHPSTPCTVMKFIDGPQLKKILLQEIRIVIICM